MFKRLRVKIVVVIMSIVGLVLGLSLGFSLANSYMTQKAVYDNALEEVLSLQGFQGPMIGRHIEGDDVSGSAADKFGLTEPNGDDSEKDKYSNSPNVLATVLEVLPDGTLLKFDEDNDSTDGNAETDDEEGASPLIDINVTATILERVMSNGETEGTDPGLGVAWKSCETDYGNLKIAVVDVSAMYAVFQKQALRDAGILVGSLLVLLLVSWKLSEWLLKPVELAWAQQRQFVGDASHELKTPLSVIIANLDILAADKTIQGSSRHWVLGAADEASHMKSLVGDLLELARTDEAGAGQANVMHKVDLDLSNMVEEVTLEFDPIAFERGCEIASNVEEGIHIEGDAEWMERLVKILVDNACKYATKDSEVTVTLKTVDRKPVLSVNNKGSVISPEDLPHIFDRFYRTDKARSRDEENGGGFGLGLAIAKGIADNHNAKLTATSSEAEGTTFTVKFSG